MIINLSNNLQEIDSFFKHYSLQKAHEILLDITGVCENIQGVSKVDKNTLDPNNIIEKESLKAYTDFAAEASRYTFLGKSIRALQVSGLPIFWISGLSEKHDSYHWGQIFFFLRQLLIEQPSFFPKNEEIHIILPQSYSSCISWLKTLFKDILSISPRISPAKAPKTLLIRWGWKYSKVLIKYAKLVLFNNIKKYLSQARDLDPKKHSNIFLTQNPQFIQGKRDWDQDLSLIYTTSVELTPQSFFLPIISSFEDLPAFNWTLADKKVIQTFPRIGQVLSMLFEIIWVQLKILIAPNKSFRFQDRKVPVAVIKTELRLAIENWEILFNLIWQQNYLSQSQGSSFLFYADEFYRQGRALSFAKRSSNNPELKSFGIQHGLFYDKHTVYCLKDPELQSDSEEIHTGLPLPDNFLVWGTFFKEYFLSNNNLPDSFVQTPGNYNYITRQLEKKSASTLSPLDRVNILWCTTLWPHALHEYRIMSDALKNPNINYSLCIRLHPVGHITKEQIKSLLPEQMYAHVTFDSNAYLLDSIDQKDLVVCTGLSTSWVDTLMAKKQACRILTDMTGDGFRNLDKINILHNVRNSKEFEQVLLDFKHPEDGNYSDLEAISYLSDDQWVKLLSQQKEPSKIH